MRKEIDMRCYKATLMRGGVCRGLMFLRGDLPDDRSAWDSIFLQAIGGPDPKQMDGVGGAVSSNSKAVVVWKSALPGIDVEYLAVQVGIGNSLVDYSSNCGNMTAAVGPFSVDQGLVDARGDICEVRLLNRNTDKRVTVTVPLENGKSAQTGDFVLEGIGGTSPELKVGFLDPAGAKTGRLLPTGRTADVFDIAGFGPVEATVLDVSNPMVLVRAADIGLRGIELPQELDANRAAMELIEAIRCTAACRLGFGENLQDASQNWPGVPKIGFFSPPRRYADITGRIIEANEMDLCVRVFSMGQPHRACPLTSACAVAVAAALPQTLLSRELSVEGGKAARIGHPSGVMAITPRIEARGGHPFVERVEISSSARRIMDGTIFIRE